MLVKVCHYLIYFVCGTVIYAWFICVYLKIRKLKLLQAESYLFLFHVLIVNTMLTTLWIKISIYRSYHASNRRHRQLKQKTVEELWLRYKRFNSTNECRRSRFINQSVISATDIPTQCVVWFVKKTGDSNKSVRPSKQYLKPNNCILMTSI